MRLRLTVQRNGLPAANVLWNVPDTNSAQAYTITRLLEDVNHVIPLEAEQWGLEHYVVELGGFECLHFSPVAQALKDDDHVSIRPLMTAEERARTLTGRHQISEDGRHLVDGIPFGRPYLRNPRRPALRIPPRKPQRLAEAGDEDESTPLHPDIPWSLPSEQIGLLTNGDTNAGAERPESEERASKRVRFKGPEVGDDDDESDEDDEDFDPTGPQSGQVVSEDEDDESEDDSDFDLDSDSDSSSGSDSSSSGSDSEDTSSDSDSGSDASAPPEVQSSKAILGVIPEKKLPGSPVLVIPGHGRSVTKSRNSRRTRTNRLRYLKDAGKLPPDANLKALDEYESANPPGQPSDSGHAKPFSSFEGKRKRIDDEDDAENVSQNGTELEQRKQALMATVGEDLDSTMAEADKTTAFPTTAQDSTSVPEVIDGQQPAKVETARKRLRPNTSAISRIIARQAMPSKRKQKTMPEVEKSPEPEGASDPNFWKDRINLSAFECWEEEFELSAPPYPFKQHWDPASKLMREKLEKKKQKGRRKRESMPIQEEEPENEEEKIFLDYDDTGATENPEAAISAAIEDQLRQDVATAAQSDLPLLPEDINTLSALASEDIKEGAVIVFKFFAVNPVTVTPEISDYKTAIVDREGDSGHGAGTIRLRIAQRDLPKREKKFDKKGNRIYEAADQFFMDDEEEDRSIWEGQFSEMLEAKLLQAA